MKIFERYINEGSLYRAPIKDILMKELLDELEKNGFEIPKQIEVDYETVKGAFGENTKKYKVKIKDKSIDRNKVIKIINKYRKLEYMYPMTKLQSGYTDISVKW